MNNNDIKIESMDLEEAIDFMVSARERTIQNMIKAGLSEEQQKIILEQLDKSNHF